MDHLVDLGSTRFGIGIWPASACLRLALTLSSYGWRQPYHARRSFVQPSETASGLVIDCDIDRLLFFTARNGFKRGVGCSTAAGAPLDVHGFRALNRGALRTIVYSKFSYTLETVIRQVAVGSGPPPVRHGSCEESRLAVLPGSI